MAHAGEKKFTREEENTCTGTGLLQDSDEQIEGVFQDYSGTDMKKFKEFCVNT